MIAEELQVAGLVGGDQLLQEQPPEQAREHAHRQEEAGPARHPALAVERDAAARHDHVDVRMMGHGRAPGMEHRGDADAGAEMLGVGRDGGQGLGRGLEQQVVDDGLVLVGDVGDGRRQREHDMKVRHRQQLGLARGQPVLCRRALALRAMPVAAGVVGDDRCARTSSQRATWPPSAAVRQFSIADITFSWPRLTWPALAWRHAGPWSRKISATSSDGRDTRAALSGGRFVPP